MINWLVGLYTHSSPLTGIMDLLEGLSPQLLTTIQSEFDKVDGESPPTPTRQSADVAAATSAPGTKGAASADPLDELFPRVDLGLIASKTTIVKDAGSDAYKTRVAALETLQALLTAPANKRLKSNLGPLYLGWSSLVRIFADF